MASLLCSNEQELKGNISVVIRRYVILMLR